MKQSNQKLVKQNSFGNVQFAREFYTKIGKRNVKDLIDTMQGMTWQVKVDQKWTLVLPYVLKTPVLFVYFKPNRDKVYFHVQIFKLISLIDFTHLHSLEIQENITSLQEIPFFNMEQISRLFFHRNKITNLKPLNKANWKNFSSFSLLLNELSSIQMERFKFNQTVTYLSIYYEGSSSEEFQDFTSLMKIEPKKVKLIRCTLQKNLIKQKNPIFRRFPKIKIH